MEGYLGQIQAQAAAVESRLIVLERAAGDALAKARAEIAAELYAAAHPNETPEVAAAKKALDDHIAETAAKETALTEAIAKQEADAKAEAEGEVPGEPAGPQEPYPEVEPEPKSKSKKAKGTDWASVDETL